MADEDQEKKSGGGLAKAILIGLPLYIIQLVAVYFVIINFFVDVKHPEEGAETENHDKAEFQDSIVTGKFIYNTEDLIINPAEGGMRLMLISLGFDVSEEEMMKTLTEKKPILNDLIITTLREKTLKELLEVSSKDTVKQLLMEGMKTAFPGMHVSEIYFNKYIIQ